MANEQDDDQVTSLISNGILLKITAFIGLLAAITAGLTVAARIYGDSVRLDGHTTEREDFEIVIGQDRLSVPANVIRFEDQRRSGPAKVVNLYLTWPEMEGYTSATAARFSADNGSLDLIFIELSQSVMSRDMSGRLDPIYRKLFSGLPEPGPAGLSLHHLDGKSGFGDEVLLTGKATDGVNYAVRCILPKDTASSTSADCQRDIHVGRDLTLLYRFSAELLPQWQAIDVRIRAFANAHLRSDT